MRLRLASVVALVPLAMLLAAGCGPTVVTTSCEPVQCAMYCEHGFAKGPDGCELCACNPPPSCEPVACNLYCEHGFAKGPDGCELCACNPAACEGPSPAGCVETGCPIDLVCDTGQGCAPSSCECDQASGLWLCTEDCGGGVCVSVAECPGEDPSGCASKGCDDGYVCDTSLGCLSSGCACDAATASWVCLPDCGGGVCVPDPTGCAEPSPAGCVETACPIGEVCMATSGVCVPSSCVCDQATGTWGCTDDCGGGVCVPG
jgi:hypothetical protein